MTTLINLFGSSSSGKSTLMADLYSEMKLRGISVEMCMEIVKEWAWENKFPTKYEQFYLIGKGIQQEARLFNKVDYIIVDSPVLISSFYAYYFNGVDNLTNTVKEFYKMAKLDGILVKNFFLTRNKPYEPKGRYQTEEESNIIAEKLLVYLDANDIRFEMLDCKDRDRVKEVFKAVGIKW